MEKLRFTLSLPQKYYLENDKGNFKLPLVMYAHGTSGDWETPLKNGVAAHLADLKIAVISIDQPIHGHRIPPIFRDQDVGWLFFNPLNFLAARDNIRQAVIDYLWLRRFTEKIKVSFKKLNFTINSKKTWFMGHSQGAQVGGTYLGIEQNIGAAFLSAPSAALINTFIPAPNRPADHPNNISPYVEFLFCEKEGVKVNLFHPLPNLLQHLYDPSDPITYAPKILNKARKRPLNLLMTQGTTDTYTPPQVFRPIATAIQVPLIGPEYLPIRGLSLRGLKKYKLPTKGNYQFDSGKATIGFTQHKVCTRKNGRKCDGHFVSFNNPKALKHWLSFFKSLLKSDVAEISE